MANVSTFIANVVRRTNRAPLPDAPNADGDYRFGSRHTGVSMFCYGDGSVRPIRNIGGNDWYAAATKAGNRFATTRQLSV